MEYKNITEVPNFSTSIIPSVKSLNGRYCVELQKSFGIAPAISQSIASFAETIYCEEKAVLESGQMKYIAVSAEEPAGKPLKDCQTVEVTLTVYGQSDDQFKDQAAKKKHVLERISRECYDQNGCLTIDDLSKIILTDERTIKRYIKQLKEEGIVIPLRGYIQCTGRGQTHKTEIIDYYLSGKMPSEIQKLTYHSIEAVCRYISNFSRVANCYFHQKMDVNEISNVVRIAPSIVKQYIELFEKHYETSDRLALILDPKMLDNMLADLKKSQTVVETWLRK